MPCSGGGEARLSKRNVVSRTDCNMCLEDSHGLPSLSACIWETDHAPVVQRWRKSLRAEGEGIAHSVECSDRLCESESPYPYPHVQVNLCGRISYVLFDRSDRPFTASLFSTTCPTSTPKTNAATTGKFPECDQEVFESPA